MRYYLAVLSFVIMLSMGSLVHADTRVYFSPNGGCQQAVVSQIAKAHARIDIAMYSFTSRALSQALVDAKARGVKIDIVLDKNQMKEHYSKSAFLQSRGIEVKFHLGPGLMHDKFAVIDERLVLTGSFNWTASAEKKNSENLLVIKDKDIAEKYQKQFRLLWSQSGEAEINKQGQLVGKE